MNDKSLLLKVDQARWWVLQNLPFYGQLGMRLSDELSDVPTAQTNGRSIKWGREFLTKLTDEETRFVLVHEVKHCAHGHFWRLPIREEAGQKAADYAINGELNGLTGIKMPADALCDLPRFGGKAEEEIYGLLKRVKRPDPDGNEKAPSGPGGDTGVPVPDPGACGSFGDPAPDEQPGGDPAGGAQGASLPAPATLREEWEQAVIQADMAQRSTGRGDLSADEQRLLNRVRAQKVDWRAECADFIKSAVDYRNPDWTRSSRRMATAPVIYPRRKSGKFGLIVFVRDTSGSVDNDTVSAFNSLIADCLGDVGSDGLLIDADSTVCAVYDLIQGDEIPATAQGGGGTDFCPAFERVNQAVADGQQIAGLIYLTDGDGSFPEAPPDYPVLWVLTQENKVPWGRAVVIGGVR